MGFKKVRTDDYGNYSYVPKNSRVFTEEVQKAKTVIQSRQIYDPDNIRRAYEFLGIDKSDHIKSQAFERYEKFIYYVNSIIKLPADGSRSQAFEDVVIKHSDGYNMPEVMQKMLELYMGWDKNTRTLTLVDSKPCNGNNTSGNGMSYKGIPKELIALLEQYNSPMQLFDYSLASQLKSIKSLKNGGQQGVMEKALAEGKNVESDLLHAYYYEVLKGYCDIKTLADNSVGFYIRDVAKINGKPREVKSVSAQDYIVSVNQLLVADKPTIHILRRTQVVSIDELVMNTTMDEKGRKTATVYTWKPDIEATKFANKIRWLSVFKCYNMINLGQFDDGMTKEERIARQFLPNA